MEKFINLLAEQFVDTDAILIKPETVFRELEEWSSLVSICIIAAIDEEYHVAVKVNELMSAITIEDLYHIVKSKIDEQ